MSKSDPDADARFRELRESGYRGPIDHDGRRVDDLDKWIDRQLDGTPRGGK